MMWPNNKERKHARPKQLPTHDYRPARQWRCCCDAEQAGKIKRHRHAHASRIDDFFEDFSDDPDLRVLVLAGAGKAFCSGGDFSADTAIEMPSLMEARRIIDNILECEKPLIAAVQGYALGLGANVPLLFDVVVAGPDAKFGDTHVKMGIGAGDGGSSSGRF